MSSEQLTSVLPGQLVVAETSFDSQMWLNYFQENKRLRADIRIPVEISIEESKRAPLMRSLQRFQIGETGDGRHLRKYASRLVKDPIYSQCVDLFIKEEQRHATMLAQVIIAMNGTLLSWHWSDVVFILLRRVLGLKTELLILLIAEVVGKCFYKCVADEIEDPAVKDLFALIVLDEIAHLDFHATFLCDQLANYHWLLKCTVYYFWCIIFYTACFVFVIDHRTALAALNVPAVDFINKCSTVFHRASAQALKISL